MSYTDFADELFSRTNAQIKCSPGVRVATAHKAGITITRVEVVQETLARPKGRYITLETPSLSILDERDAPVIEAAADQLQSLLPPKGKILVVGVGNRRVTADAIGPRVIQKILVTASITQAHAHTVPQLRPVYAVAPGVAAATGIPLITLVQSLVQAVQPVAVLCVDSLVSSEAARLGRTMQFSDTGLCPATHESAKHLTKEVLGVPVIAAGIPTIMDAKEGDNFVVAPRALDEVVNHGSALLAAAINRALQPSFTLSQLCWLAN